MSYPFLRHRVVVRYDGGSDLEAAIHERAVAHGLVYQFSMYDQDDERHELHYRHPGGRRALGLATASIAGIDAPLDIQEYPHWPLWIRLFKWSDLIPFQRCDCGKFTRVFWRYRDPHFKHGKFVGPDSCLPF